MNEYKKWETTFENVSNDAQDYKFNCNRCNTKNTHATYCFKIKAKEIAPPKETIYHNPIPFDKEEFIIVKCSTCGAYTVIYRYYFGKLVEKKGEIISSISYPQPPKKLYTVKHEITKELNFPVSVSNLSANSLISDEYDLMHKCFLIGSSPGVAIHYRRMLDKIFKEYEKQYLSEKEKKIKDIKQRANKISEKSPFFKSFNENIKDLKGIVSAIVHDDYENLELSSELEIIQEDFDKLDEIIPSLLKVYELEFKDLPNIKEKSKRVSRLKNG